MIVHIPQDIIFDEYLDYDKMVKSYNQTGIGILIRAGQNIEKLSQDGLIGLIHAIYKKWPHNTKKQFLIEAAKRAIQTIHYEKIYKVEPGKAVIEANQKCLDMLSLCDTIPSAKPVKIPKKIAIGAEMTKPELEAQPEKQKLPKKAKNEFSAKVASMSLEDLIKWATEVGVPQENIDKHKAKPTGLAKMNISNMVRARVKKN